MFRQWAKKFSNDLAIDLGTANTLVFAGGRLRWLEYWPLLIVEPGE